MKLREVVTQDGEIWVDEEYADKYRRYTHTFVADDSLEPSSQPPPLYPGYSRVPDDSSLPGVPIFSRFICTSHWPLYQPETYRLCNAYRHTPAESRGTLGLRTASAYHVTQVGTFYVKSGGNTGNVTYYETPNTSCSVERRDGLRIGLSSSSNEVARFLGGNTFLLGSDVSAFGEKLDTVTDVLAFVNGEPQTVRARVYGLLSASLQGRVIVAPLLPSFNPSSLLALVNKGYMELKEAVFHEIPVEPPEIAMFTGSSSGTVNVKFEKDVAYYKFTLQFGQKEYYLAFRRGWIYRGEAKLGDSGAPLFRIVPPRGTGPPSLEV